MMKRHSKWQNPIMVRLNMTVSVLARLQEVGQAAAELRGKVRHEEQERGL